MNKALPLCVQECDHIEVQLCRSLQLLGSCEHIVNVNRLIFLLAVMKCYDITKSITKEEEPVAKWETTMDDS